MNKIRVSSDGRPIENGDRSLLNRNIIQLLKSLNRGAAPYGSRFCAGSASAEVLYELVESQTRKTGMTKKQNLEAMSVDELWQFHEEISQVLSVRLTSEKRELEKRLAQLRREKETRQTEDVETTQAAPRERRLYPRVYPKYRNPKEPSETWSGRGKQPRWLAAELKSGRSIEEFAIGASKPSKQKRRRKS
jgi:DNA-binding protein H-NS